MTLYIPDRQTLRSQPLLSSFHLTINWFPSNRRRYSTHTLLHRQSTPQNSLDGTLSSKVNAGQTSRSARRKRSAACCWGFEAGEKAGYFLGEAGCWLHCPGWTGQRYSVFILPVVSLEVYLLFFQFPNLSYNIVFKLCSRAASLPRQQYFNEVGWTACKTLYKTKVAAMFLRHLLLLMWRHHSYWKEGASEQSSQITQLSSPQPVPLSFFNRLVQSTFYKLCTPETYFLFCATILFPSHADGDAVLGFILDWQKSRSCQGITR